MSLGKIKLNQAIAVEKSLKARIGKERTELHHRSMKPELYEGFDKTFVPKNEGEDVKPSDKKLVQLRVQDVLEEGASQFVEMINATAVKDFGNVIAKADIIVDGETLAENVPVPHLLYLEKELAEFATFVRALPILDESEEWKFDEQSQVSRTSVTVQNVTRKDQVPVTLYEATDKHPAQTQLITKDVVIGQWETQRISGAMSRKRKMHLLDRIGKLREAVIKAREEANGMEIDSVSLIGDAVIDYILH